MIGQRRSRSAVIAIVVAAFVLLAGATAWVSSSSAADSGPIALPDMQIEVPTNLISVGTNGNTGDPQLQFTHITWDAGTGPFEIDPTYNSAMGTATFTQAIYRSPSPGVWTLDHHSLPLAITGTWDPPSDYNFPLTRFTLNTVNADGSLGSVVATSPKTDYCITADAFVGGVPNAPNQTYIPQSNCTDPTKPLGWSVGWGDQYDQTDAGQPIDLTNIADGTYMLRAIVDPDRVFTESNPNNNETDTLLKITGTDTNVTVLSQTMPSPPPPGATTPSVTLTSPTSGSNASGTVTLRASASAQPPATVRSVQFLIDGLPLGRPVTKAPYSYSWTVGSTAPGKHYLSARVTDSAGNVATARAVLVTVPRASSLKVRSARWRRGVLTLVVSGVPKRSTLRAELLFSRHRSRFVTVRNQRLRLRTARPRLIELRIMVGRRQIGRTIKLSLDAKATITITNPIPHETVSGIVPIAAQATDGVAVSYVQFSIGGKRVGAPITSPPYAIKWDTRKLAPGRHTLSARATNVTGNSATANVVVTVQNPAPPMTCFVLQAQVSAHGTGTVTTPGFHTVIGGETLVAFVGADGPAGAGQQTATVRGAGLKWRLVKRANASAGDSEIWTARAPRIFDAARITATFADSRFDTSLTVIAMEGVNGVGTAAGASGLTGAPQVKLKTRSATSLVFAAGNDWDRAVPRILPAGWVSLNQWLDDHAGNTFWSQYTNQPTGHAGTVVNVRAASPANDRWNLVAVELVGSGD
jgi:Bacterial Ig domain/Lysyl oxidase